MNAGPESVKDLYTYKPTPSARTPIKITIPVFFVAIAIGPIPADVVALSMLLSCCCYPRQCNVASSLDVRGQLSFFPDRVHRLIIDAQLIMEMRTTSYSG